MALAEPDYLRAARITRERVESNCLDAGQSTFHAHPLSNEQLIQHSGLNPPHHPGHLRFGIQAGLQARKEDHQEQDTV